MPELPEVERARKLVGAVAAGRRIERVWCDDDRIVFAGVTPATVQKKLQGRTIESVGRKGKYLWFVLDQRPWPLFHFGMTGSFRVPNEVPLPLSSDAKDADLDWPPRFSKIHLHFDDGGELVMTNKRRLGRIRLLTDPLTEPPVSKLGFDPLLELPSSDRFTELLARRTGSLKGVLLSQGFAAGVGNWIADEVLYQAELDPNRRIPSLTELEVEELRSKLGSVIRKAVSVDADKTRFPQDWLFHHRWGKDPAARTSRGEVVHYTEIAGRTTAWVPTRQK